MPDIPSAIPDKAKIRALIRRRGDSITDFAREIGIPRDRIWDITSRGEPRPVAVRTLRPIARGLRVKLRDISDWDGDDIDSEPEPEALASLDAERTLQWPRQPSTTPPPRDTPRE